MHRVSRRTARHCCRRTACSKLSAHRLQQAAGRAPTLCQAAPRGTPASPQPARAATGCFHWEPGARFHHGGGAGCRWRARRPSAEAASLHRFAGVGAAPHLEPRVLLVALVVWVAHADGSRVREDAHLVKRRPAAQRGRHGLPVGAGARVRAGTAHALTRAGGRARWPGVPARPVRGGDLPLWTTAGRSARACCACVWRARVHGEGAGLR